MKQKTKYTQVLKGLKGEIKYIDYRNYLAIKNGFKDYTDYQKSLVIKKGFKDLAERQRDYKYKNGRQEPMSENKGCSSFLGVYIAERYLSKIYENVCRTPYANKGYDFVCGKGFKIDVKSSCFHEKISRWDFALRRNKIADYFLLLAFDNRESLNPLHIWLIPNDREIKVYTLSIFDTEYSLSKYKQYEQTDKLDKLIACCDSVRKKGE